ncbi:MAG TPA: type VI secretion system baseplate subunit TssG, partial [Planctomycetota bacterium]|nr:type VI secretion system baseplate subunit TssG [Planctomycetota bacterium]
MEAASGRPHLGVVARLCEEPQDFEFFQAVRLLELEAGRAGERAPIGFDAPPEREALRIRAAPSLAYPAAPLPSLTTGADGTPELRQSTLGLVGALGVLPQHYTELVLKRVQQKDFALSDFLDLFHHRAAAFIFRAWRKYRFAFDYEHVRQGGRGDDD